GFSRIIIGVNRTTDLTPSIISKISVKYPQVEFMNMDWIDQGCASQKNSQFQALSYACLSNKIKYEFKEITHILYVDVDEFWFPKDFKTSIKSYLKTLQKFDLLSFNWLWQNGDDNLFDPPFNNKKVTKDHHMKSMVCVSSLGKIIEFRCHASKMDSQNSKLIHLGPNGEPIEYGAHDQAFKYIPKLNSEAFILHRVCRSETEYVALLTRSRPGVEFPFKNNRFGFSKKSNDTLSIDTGELNLYWSELQQFVEYCEISSLIAESKKIIESKSKFLLDMRSDLIAGHLIALLNILNGTEYQKQVILKLEESGASILKDQYAKNYFDAGIKFEQTMEMQQSLRYMRLANLARPNGPVIKENLERLEKEALKKKSVTHNLIILITLGIKKLLKRIMNFVAVY
ncbi:hypothetical protein, partial [Paraglaciecola sp.]